jgi:hypothetical protein
LIVFAEQLQGIQVVSLTVGIVAVSIAGVASLIVVLEKITGGLGRWFERHFKESLHPTNERISDLAQQVEHADSYNRFHLGPNGITTPIHQRLQVVEKRMAEIADQDGRLLRMMQAAAKHDTEQ